MEGQCTGVYVADLDVMPVFTGAYISDTSELSAEEHGAYLLILMKMWREGASLPSDPDFLQNVGKIPPRRWPKVWGKIGKFFRPLADGRIDQKRLREEYDKALARKEIAKTNGSMSKGRPQVTAQSAKSLNNKGRGEATGYITGYPDGTHTEPTPNPERNPATKLNGTHGETLSRTSSSLSKNPTTPTSSGTAREGGGEDSKPEDRKAEDARWTALCKSIVKAYEDSNSTILPDTGWVDIWRGRGYDPAMCLTIVKAGVKAKPSIGTLKYFDNQLEQEHAKITTARKQSEGLAPKKDEFDWHPMMRIFVGTSPRTWIHPSPRPGLISCIVPLDILEEYLPDMYPPRKPKEPCDAQPPSGARPASSGVQPDHAAASEDGESSHPHAVRRT